METLKIKIGDTFYLLHNLSEETVRELKNDPQKLKAYTNNCFETGLNICALENEESSDILTANRMEYSNTTSTSIKSTPSTSGNQKYSFLCGNVEAEPYIMAVKFGKHPWHYFEELDSLMSNHSALPSSIDFLIRGLTKMTSVDILLSEEKVKNYFNNGKFVFRNKKLKTYMELINEKSENQLAASKSSNKSLEKSTTQLVFASGETNPLLFLNQFEKCYDLKTDKDKTYKIRNFVDECHKAEFAKLYFTGVDWPTVKSAFLKLYSPPFTLNKKKD